MSEENDLTLTVGQHFKDCVYQQDGLMFAECLNEKGAALIVRAVNGLGEVEAIYNAALPFNDAFGEDEPDLPDNTPVTLAFGPCRDFSLTVGDLRRLRAALSRKTGGEKP